MSAPFLVVMVRLIFLGLGGLNLGGNWILMFKLDYWVCWVLWIFIGLLMKVMKGDDECDIGM